MEGEGGNEPTEGGRSRGRVAVTRVAVSVALVAAAGYMTTILTPELVSRVLLGAALVPALAIVAWVRGRPSPWVLARLVVVAGLVALLSPLNGAAALIGLGCLPVAGLMHGIRHPRSFWLLLWLPAVVAFLAGCLAYAVIVMGGFVVDWMLSPLSRWIGDSWVPVALWAVANVVGWTTAAVRFVASASSAWEEGGLRAWLDAFRSDEVRG